MSVKYVYTAVLVIVLSAWFGHSTTKPPSPPKPQEVDSKQVVSKIVEDPTTLGIKSGGWIAGGNCNIEFINGVPMNNDVHPISKNNILKLVGWAMDTEKGLLPDQVVVIFTSIGGTDFYALSKDGLRRDDVKEYFNLPNQLNASGFELTTNLKNIPAGQYDLSLLIQFKGTSYVCDNGRKIRIE